MTPMHRLAWKLHDVALATVVNEIVRQYAHSAIDIEIEVEAMLTRWVGDRVPLRGRAERIRELAAYLLTWSPLWEELGYAEQMERDGDWPARGRRRRVL